MPSRLKELLAQGRLVHVFGFGQLCYPKLIEMVGLTGAYEAVWLDQEHVGLTIPQIEETVRAARLHGMDSFVRLTATDYATVMRPLEAGAGGIMAAQVRSAREAEQIVHWAKFHPEGLRGVNGSGADGKFSTIPMTEYLKQANASTFIAIQIEHLDAVDDVEKIAAVPGVDVLFIGPADLTQSMGIPADWNNPRLWDAINRVATAAAKAGIHWAILPLGTAFAEKCIQMGCKMLSGGMDVWAFNKGLAALAKDRPSSP